MFFVRNLRSTNPHKLRKLPNYFLFKPWHRENLSTVSQDFLKQRRMTKLQYLSFFDFYIYSLGGGFLHHRFVNSIFTYSKKLLKLLKKSSKVWLNIPIGNVHTRKPLNVRMGKGKGSRRGVNARILLGQLLITIQGARLGHWRKIVRLVKSHTSFKLACLRNKKYSFNRYNSFNSLPQDRQISQFAGSTGFTNPMPHSSKKISSKRKVTTRIVDTYIWLQKLRKLKMLLYFFRFFRRYSRKYYIYRPLSMRGIFYAFSPLLNCKKSSIGWLYRKLQIRLKLENFKPLFNATRAMRFWRHKEARLRRLRKTL